MPELGLLDTLRAMTQMNQQVGQNARGYGLLNPGDPEAAFVDAMNARSANPHNRDLRDAEHYWYMRQLPEGGTVRQPSMGMFQPAMGMNTGALLPLLYSLLKVGQQNYGMPEFSAGGMPFQYKQSTPPDLMELLWGLRGAGGPGWGPQP